MEVKSYAGFSAGVGAGVRMALTLAIKLAFMPANEAPGAIEKGITGDKGI